MMLCVKSHEDNAEFFAALDKAGFKPSKWDHPTARILDRKSGEGPTDLRIVINYEGETRPHNLQLVKFDGKRSQIIEWESNHMSAHMPTTVILALIKAA